MSIYYYCQKCSGTFDPAHTQCPNCDAPDDRDKEIASLRATIARLGAVARAAEDLLCRASDVYYTIECTGKLQATEAALTALTPKDRRRAGIE